MYYVANNTEVKVEIHFYLLLFLRPKNEIRLKSNRHVLKCRLDTLNNLYYFLFLSPCGILGKSQKVSVFFSLNPYAHCFVLFIVVVSTLSGAISIHPIIFV